MTANSHNITALADRLVALAEAHKEDVAAVIEDAKEAEVDTSALRRLASWKRKDAVKRAEQEALDEQYRFLAGELPEPAALPTEGELAEAAALFGEGKSVREVSAALKISVGKAHQLKVKASAFSVHQKMNVNIVNASAPVEMTAEDIGQWLPPHDEETGELIEPPREMVADDLGDPLLITNPFRAKIRAAAAGIKRAPVVRHPQALDNRSWDEIVGERPDFLRRAVPA